MLPEGPARYLIKSDAPEHGSFRYATWRIVTFDKARLSWSTGFVGFTIDLSLPADHGVVTGVATTFSDAPGSRETAEVRLVRVTCDNRAPSSSPPSPSSAERARQPLRVGGDVVAPVVVTRANPDWSKLPKNFRYTGIVILEMVIDENGKPVQVRALKGQPALADPAIAAVRQWRFKPGTLHGKPVPVIYNLTVNPHFR